MSKLSILIPIHKINPTDHSFLEKMATSVNTQKDKDFKVAIMLADGISTEDEQTLKGYFESSVEVDVIRNKKETDYYSQVNYFVEDHLNTPYFAVLQYDDELLNNFTLNANKYTNSYPEVDMFTNITYEFHDNGEFIGFSNEAIWSPNHSKVRGYYDIDTLKNNKYYKYNNVGAVIKAETFIEIGGLKKSIKMFNDLEFMLRISNLGKKVMTIPKICYRHVNGREGSLFSQLKNETKADEEKFWFNLAKKEYHFDYDREVEYEALEAGDV